MVDEDAAVEDLLHELVEPPWDTLAVAQKVEQLDQEGVAVEDLAQDVRFHIFHEILLGQGHQVNIWCQLAEDALDLQHGLTQNGNGWIGLQAMFLENLQLIIQEIGEGKDT